jgi:RimJ/RimL family protein N-acetyltransferase
MGQYRGAELDELELTGKRLLLRRWAPDDADRVHAVMQDPSMGEFLALPDPYTPAEAARFVGQIGHEGRAEGTGLGSALVELGSGRVIGSAALRLAGDPEIGYWIAPDAQGNGYAAEATAILAAWAFTLGCHRVRLICDVRNLASARTALAAGFSFEGAGRDAILGGGAGSVPERRGDLARFARLADDPPGRLPYAFTPLPAVGLDDGVLRLRALRPDDGAALAETDDELTLSWGFTGQAHSADATARAAARAGLDWLVGRAAAFALEDVASGRFAGVLNLRNPGPPQVGGVGYVVHPAFRGRGYTTRALRLLVPWAFEVADFARLELGVKPGNEASIRAAAAAGFEPDGIRRTRLRNPDGTFSDEVRFALINPKHA